MIVVRAGYDDIAQPLPELLVLAIATPAGQDRTTARQLVRARLQSVLAAHLACPAAQVELLSSPGSGLRLAAPKHRIGLSISHESGLSLAAIHLAGQVGIDLLAVPATPAWQAEISTLAADYLGPDCARHLATLPPAQQVAAFARAWTAHEACLKLHGEGLREWNEEEMGTAGQKARCRIRPLALPAGYVGSVAIPA